jgi:indoleamine 2,3-dioxygenase
MSILPTLEIKGERTLRRAHHVLAWLMHFYIHTLPSTSPILVPSSISTPLLAICSILRLPPVLTYSDDVLYNWSLPQGHTHPTPSNLLIQTTFTSTRDEAEFYLASARIELHGVQVLSLLSTLADESFIADSLALSRITHALRALRPAIDTLTSTLLAVREGCDPSVFYNEIRPWFKGQDAAPGARKWEFEDADPDHEWIKELSGPSAGQSALVHAIDIFLGVAEHTHADGVTGKSSQREENAKHGARPFLERMQLYMPRHHRAFLSHLASSSTPLRALIEERTGNGQYPELLGAYNEAVMALKRFRDAHMRIVAIYIVGPARRAEREVREQEGLVSKGDDAIKGTGGTELVKFLKEVRDRTAGAVLGGEA